MPGDGRRWPALATGPAPAQSQRWPQGRRGRRAITVPGGRLRQALAGLDRLRDARDLDLALGDEDAGVVVVGLDGELRPERGDLASGSGDKEC